VSAAESEDARPVVNVLHLTDLHFDAEAPTVERRQRSLAYEALLESLNDIVRRDEVPSSIEPTDPPPRPDFVVMSGDIAYHGTTEDYEQARKFLDELLGVLELPPARIVAAPGNHDRNLSHARGLGYPRDAVQCDEWLSPEALAPIDGSQGAALVVPFLNYVEFCRNAELARPAGLPGLEHLTGVHRATLDSYAIDFVVVNSAWFAYQAASDMQNMWLGLPLLQAISAPYPEGRLLPRLSEGEHPHRLVVGICHHPREWLHQEEHDSYSNRPNTFRYLAESCHVLLSGHVHGALEPPTAAHNCAQTFTGGATYGRGYFRNNFSLLQVDFADRSVTRAGYEYNPRIGRWEEQTQAAGTYPLFHTSRHADPDLETTDLTGAWRSVFWTEHQPAGRKGYRDVTLESRGKGRFRTAKDASFSLDGSVSDGYFSGRWRDVADGRSLHGTFQVKIEEPTRMVGRWVGFDKSDEIRVGLWRFSRSDEEAENAKR
jgi:hypothetical protein